MASITSSANGDGRTRSVSPEEGQKLLVQQLLATARETGDLAAEQTWQSYGILLLRHGERFLETLGPEKLLKMQQMCAEMVLKIRLAARKGAGTEEADQLAEYEQMLEDIFTAVPLDPLPDDEDDT